MSYNAMLRSDNVIRNHAGAKAWMQSPEFELYSTVACTMSVDDKFYESATDRINRIAALVRLVPAEFVAQLAVYARTEMHLRSVPMLLLVELSQCHSGDSLVSRATAKAIQRVDDITELLSCYQMRHRAGSLKRLSNQLLKGIAMSFCKFDEYQFAKYKEAGKPVTLRDALFLAHPKAESEEQQELFDKIARRQLKTPYTWETQLSEAGKTKGLGRRQRKKLMRKVWTELIESRRMGYMAMLRNLNNMLSAKVDEKTMQIVYDYLSNEQAVQRSKQLPFRFLSAYLMLDKKKEECMRNRLNQIRSRKPKLLRAIKRLQHFITVKRKVVRKRPKLSLMALRLHNAGLGEVKHWHCVKKQEVLLPRTRFSSHRSKFIAYQQNRLAMLEKKDSELWAELTSKNEPRWVWSDNPAKMERFEPLRRCLETAIKHSAANIPAFDFDTRVCIACDTSGSMFQPVSRNSIIRCYDLSLLFGAMMNYRCRNAVVGMFGDDWLPVEMPAENIIKNVLEMRSKAGLVGFSTNGHKAIDWLCDEGKVMDKVLIFTDCQLWDSWNGGDSLAKSWAKYKKTVAPDAKLYLFDLAGYGQNPIDVDHEKDVYMIAGWSDKVFHMLAALEKGSSAIDEIRRIVV
ncbi:MAG: TROVE domain-containing protein [Bacteroidales bacterium]|nr:TROVE domain-containing protein [Bacteroidales bacterium]